jgi:predicted aspartyl protease
MLLDTGADLTCFPAALASEFGHDNQHAAVEVQKDAVKGIGGGSDAYIHTLEIGFIHPSKSTLRETILAWSSKPMKIQFVEKMECGHGLIGMDLIGQWEKFTLRKNKLGLAIEITF